MSGAIPGGVLAKDLKDADVTALRNQRKAPDIAKVTPVTTGAALINYHQNQFRSSIVAARPASGRPAGGCPGRGRITRLCEPAAERVTRGTGMAIFRPRTPARTEPAMNATEVTSTHAAAAGINVIDRCDRCGAAAKVRALLEGGGELLFCGHHARAHEDRLREMAVALQSV
jgi:hypothetical protein